MMQSVVREGTGTASALNGVDVAGKTGTAEVNKRCPNQALDGSRYCGVPAHRELAAAEEAAR